MVEILRKRREEIADLKVEVEGHQAADPPWQYERVVLHYRLTGLDLRRATLERVIRLAVVRYCSVLATLAGVARIEATLELVGADGESSGRLPVRLDVEVGEPLEVADPTIDEE